MQSAEFIDDKTIKVTDESGTEELTFDRLSLILVPKVMYQILMA